MSTLHADEPRVDAVLVRRLIAQQFPQWAELPVEAVASGGTSNVMYRLGEDMVVRLPRRSGSVDEVAKEDVWLPRLAPSLPVPVPVLLGEGLPAEGYPWRWTVYRWIEGENPVVGRIAEPGALATALAEFVVALQGIDPADGPPSYRGESLKERDAETREALADLRGVIDTDAAAAAWEAALRAPERTGPPVWIHADLQPGNLLISRGRLSAVIDFECLGLGDPAVDLIVAWYVLPAGVRDAFRAALPLDDAAWARGRGWALSIALMELSYYRNKDPRMATVARHVVDEVLADAARTA
ncbi:aminoglycoside phosphotransferase family protein [Streptomyces spectabilis]|uniref:Aminoglycoside phosphotransferase (APT) family kinase protein n=1 Tax=Streptomyces spectabilis TaxID=68270 RepID=A0A5P2X3W6_STRST|nr:aminoglycoside phosphotransferase family protein [Streptomyces spectabilis]MBB5101194.1 aminoglycoside phosphotransferase (APT) family kinase protein [Streptomyces spectabilis]MCI3900396.1 aminoglycoside phosphotransferase family protein [Streptomyces spectabilis]QEV57979.1 aminoglycoside phosphotransferase family protein [Streptomyces spectabilis]GGV09941.1 phosphotransferase [Streptomyces spectabilis]